MLSGLLKVVEFQVDYMVMVARFYKEIPMS